VSGVVVLETLRRHLTNILALIYLGLLVILGLASSRLEGMIWPPFITLLSLGAGAGLIGPEFSSGTLQLILVKPINRSVYLVSRFAGVVLFIAIAAALGFGAETVGRLIWGGTEHIDRAALALLNSVSGAALTCAILAFFGTFLRAYFNIALYWLIQIVLGLVKNILIMSRVAKDGFLGWLHDVLTRFPIIEKALDWTTHNLFADEPHTFDRDWLLMVWSNALVALVLACFVFRRREVPYGAD
jgi:ABC-type transport system involved in multi-copper enzyme maturation permease subunit